VSGRRVRVVLSLPDAADALAISILLSRAAELAPAVSRLAELAELAEDAFFRAHARDDESSASRGGRAPRSQRQDLGRGVGVVGTLRWVRDAREAGRADLPLLFSERARAAAARWLDRGSPTDEELVLVVCELVVADPRSPAAALLALAATRAAESDFPAISASRLADAEYAALAAVRESEDEPTEALARAISDRLAAARAAASAPRGRRRRRGGGS
jgi:hypothetical protein